MSQTDWKKLIDAATKELGKHWNNGPGHCEGVAFHQGAALPNELLLIALEALEFLHNTWQNQYGTSEPVVEKALADIRKTLETK